MQKNIWYLVKIVTNILKSEFVISTLSDRDNFIDIMNVLYQILMMVNKDIFNTDENDKNKYINYFYFLLCF